ncbi:hypothetical protein [Frankia sp. Cj5]|uniref:hypothetical protein n=1 Tax=Frankia sp. Cj5 TaxID=2880978 RepID=UPI001EF45E74|nr:hypothetical protein [Frankia sp. Cj5]
MQAQYWSGESEARPSGVEGVLVGGDQVRVGEHGQGVVDAAAVPAERYEAQAWLASAFSDHFLTDAFAAGHLVSGDAGRRTCADFFTRNEQAIYNACVRCAQADGLLPDDAVNVVAVFERALRAKASSLLLKTVHDYYNAHGVQVRNALGQQWTTFGDANLGGHPETARMAELASKASRDAVQDVLTTGGTARGSAAVDYVPDLARVGGGPWQSIAAFSTDPAVWDPALAHALSPDPSVNALYSVVKGNIGPMTGVLARKGGRAVGQAAESGRNAVTSIPDDIAHWFGTIEQGIRNLYGVP